ncbi:hypothetical protein, partial [Cronobacter malonaticus]|uniref:hypothetical protein n=1 Tax=Cronobacter malonaticus TaxID=413503 RepID=UPI001F437C56
FDTNKEENDKGECLPKVKTNIKDGMNVHLINFFMLMRVLATLKRKERNQDSLGKELKVKTIKKNNLLLSLFCYSIDIK